MIGENCNILDIWPYQNCNFEMNCSLLIYWIGRKNLKKLLWLSTDHKQKFFFLNPNIKFRIHSSNWPCFSPYHKKSVTYRIDSMIYWSFYRWHFSEFWHQNSESMTSAKICFKKLYQLCFLLNIVIQSMARNNWLIQASRVNLVNFYLQIDVMQNYQICFIFHIHIRNMLFIYYMQKILFNIWKVFNIKLATDF